MSNCMGLAYVAQGNYDEALESFGKALDIRLSCFGDEHLDVGARVERFNPRATESLESLNDQKSVQFLS